MNGNGTVSGTPPISNAMIMGNYGVTVRYVINIDNRTNQGKEITYKLGTQSHAIVSHMCESTKKWETVFKCYTPNADTGGFKNMLEITD